MPARALLTYSDHGALPDDGRRYELHRGELTAIPTSGTRHQGPSLASALADACQRHVSGYGV
jgi:hypothetical protein